jgi:hypothetical protein
LQQFLGLMKSVGKKFQTVTKDIAVAPVNFTGQAKHKTFVIIAVLVKFEGDKQELFLCIVAALLITIHFHTCRHLFNSRMFG